VVFVLACRHTPEEQESGSWLERQRANAEKYRVHIIGLSTVIRQLSPPASGTECWDWARDGVINEEHPQPCEPTDSKDIGYMRIILDYVADHPSTYDTSQLYAYGFSKDATFTAYLAYCFPSAFAGLFQMGSGLMVKGLAPYSSHSIGQECTQSGYWDHGYPDCATLAPCADCQYLPIIPCWSPLRPMVHCMAAFDDDSLSVSQDHMYALARAEGHDVRLLHFEPSAEASGHSLPPNDFDWIVGCLGVAPDCSTQCADSFSVCIEDLLTSTPSFAGSAAFAACSSPDTMGELAGCEARCAPTLDMLERSTSLHSLNLSLGSFGRERNLVQERPTDSICVAFDDELTVHSSSSMAASTAAGVALGVTAAAALVLLLLAAIARRGRYALCCWAGFRSALKVHEPPRAATA